MDEPVGRLGGWRHLRDVVSYRAAAELRAEASRTFIGYVWWIIHPLISLGVYYVAFQLIMKRGGDGYALFLFSGIIFWQWFQMSVLRCSGALIAARALIQQVRLHKVTFPLSVVLVNLFKFGITFVLLCVVLALNGHFPGWHWLSLVPLLLTQILLVVGIGCSVAAISPFFPDFQLILETTFQLLFFLSGIFFDVSTLSGPLHAVLEFNPMAVLISEYRTVMLDGSWFDPARIIIPLIQGAGAVCFGLWLLNRNDKVYAKLG